MNNFIHTNNGNYIRTSFIKHLAKFKNKKINILEIGVFEGAGTKWFLTNLITHKDSLLYAVDSFEGSPEYNLSHFESKVKKKFLESIRSTKKEKQVRIMEMYSYNALIELISKNNGKLMFDIIYVDASHEAKDVISDAILSWNILNIGGVMIFDDYKWNLLLQEYSKPKIAVDSFIEIMKPSLNILHKGYKVIIEKKKIDIANDPISFPKNKPLSKIISEIDELYINLSDDFIYDYSNSKNKKNIKNIPKNLNILIDENKLLLENILEKQININNIPNLLISTMSYNTRFYSDNPIFNKLENRYELQKKDAKVFNKFNKFNNIIIERSRNNTFIKSWLDFYYENYYSTDSLVSLIKNFTTTKKKITLLHFKDIYDYTGQFKKDIELNYFKKQMSNIFKYYHEKKQYKLVDISISINNFKNKNIIKKNVIFNDITHNQLNLNSLENIIDLGILFKGKIDILHLQYDTDYSHHINNNLYLKHLMIFTLLAQNKGGHCHIHIYNILNSSNYKIIEILSKYYKKCLFKIPKCYMAITKFMTLVLEDFKGIPEKEFESIKKSIFIKSNDNEVSNTIPKELLLFNKQLYEKYFNELKLIKRINLICDELHSHDYHKFLKIINNKIFNKQMEYLFLWINTLIK